MAKKMTLKQYELFQRMEKRPKKKLTLQELGNRLVKKLARK